MCCAIEAALRRWRGARRGEQEGQRQDVRIDGVRPSNACIGPDALCARVWGDEGEMLSSWRYGLMDVNYR